jgi:hypothetical protein
MFCVGSSVGGEQGCGEVLFTHIDRLSVGRRVETTVNSSHKKIITSQLITVIRKFY